MEQCSDVLVETALDPTPDCLEIRATEAHSALTPAESVRRPAGRKSSLRRAGRQNRAELSGGQSRLPPRRLTPHGDRGLPDLRRPVHRREVNAA